MAPLHHEDLAQVVLPLPLESVYSYSIPAAFQGNVREGMRVIVPFGRRTLTGYVVGMTRELPPGKVRAIHDVVDAQSLLSPEVLAFCRRLGEYYLCSWGEVLKAALPPAINGTSRRYFERHPDPQAARPIRMTPAREKLLRLIEGRGALSKAELSRLMGSQAFVYDLGLLLREGWLVSRSVVEKARGQGRQVSVYSLGTVEPEEGWTGLIASRENRAPRQAALLRWLLDKPRGAERSAIMEAGFGSGVLQALHKSGHLQVEQRDAAIEEQWDTDHSVRSLVLSGDQQKVVERISPLLRRPGSAPGQHKAFLLFGVTGSGKTQVYLELARRALKKERSVLILVPEIALTPQIVARFRSFLGQDVAVIHSKLSSAQRFAIWRRIRKGEIRTVIGARSALFAPLPDLGLVVVDEEHETSFKQFEPQPRYHARDAALLRAHHLGIPVVLGSATPSMESWRNAREGKFELLRLSSRIRNRPLPEVELVDMKENLEQLAGKGRTVRAFGDRLIKRLIQVVERGEKAIILQNRRGFSPWVACETCREPLRCLRCDLTLTWHRTDHKCHCHMCGLAIDTPQKCPACGNGPLLLLGAGTQKIEEELEEMFPEARLLRMDRDTTGDRDAYVRMVREFNKGDYDVLLGTRSVAKGLDFADVTLVGVINADTELNLQDFRAQEWGYQLISQVAGRAGRGDKPGVVIAQSFDPEAEVLQFAARHDFEGFAEKELAARKALAYPPFGRLCRLLLKSLDEERARSACEGLKARLRPIAEPIQLLGPGPAPVLQVRREYRYQILLKSPRSKDPSGRLLRDLARKARELFEKHHRTRDLSLVVDIDPQSLM